MAKKKANKQLIYVVMAALFAAIITVVTASVLHIPTGNGYIHLGDSFIFLAASLLPLPYAIAAAAVGAGLADALTAPIWVIATVIIKSLIVLPFTSKKDKIINARNLIALIPALIVTCVGYYLADRILFGAWGAFAAVIPNAVSYTGRRERRYICNLRSRARRRRIQEKGSQIRRLSFWLI